tara:strand:+ start:483 stop:773 length:291 start_codon:yes stop_codon:yes gene_type:complete
MDHLVVVQVVEWEHLLDLVAQHRLFHHLKVVMVAMLVAVQTILVLLMDPVEAAVPVVVVLLDQVLHRGQVVLEFKYQIFQLLLEIVDTLVVVEQVV